MHVTTWSQISIKFTTVGLKKWQVRLRLLEQIQSKNTRSMHKSEGGHEGRYSIKEQRKYKKTGKYPKHTSSLSGSHQSF
jgi:hypothetical protein